MITITLSDGTDIKICNLVSNVTYYKICTTT